MRTDFAVRRVSPGNCPSPAIESNSDPRGGDRQQQRLAPVEEVTQVGTAPASAREALDMVRAGWATWPPPTPPRSPPDPGAECLRELERAQAVATAARASQACRGRPAPRPTAGAQRRLAPVGPRLRQRDLAADTARADEHRVRPAALHIQDLKPLPVQRVERMGDNHKTRRVTGQRGTMPPLWGRPLAVTKCSGRWYWRESSSRPGSWTRCGSSRRPGSTQCRTRSGSANLVHYDV